MRRKRARGQRGEGEVEEAAEWAGRRKIEEDKRKREHGSEAEKTVLEDFRVFPGNGVLDGSCRARARERGRPSGREALRGGGRRSRFRLRFPGERAGWSSRGRYDERKKSGKSRGRTSITLEKRKTRAVRPGGEGNAARVV